MSDDVCLVVFSYCIALHQITASEASGAFYGVQTLLGLAAETDANNLSQGRIPHCEISDYPRYPYRGMHVDISRNFQV